MPRHCCVSGYKSNYDSTLKDGQCVSTFSFPKEETRYVSWIRAIPRKDWTPSKCSVVCSKYFNESDIIYFDTYLQPNDSVQRILLRHPKLKESVFFQVYRHI
jgi:hypothetical protein